MNTTKTSLLSLLSLAVFICFSTTLVHAGKFIDDRGVEFNFDGKPKLATRAATGALSLYRMGTCNLEVNEKCDTLNFPTNMYLFPFLIFKRCSR